jgi:CheY-like chemotaxis protein
LTFRRTDLRLSGKQKLGGEGLIFTMHILVAEDDENDAFLLKRAFGKLARQGSVHFCCNGEEALDYLEGVGKYQNRQAHPLPTVFITDLKMPRMDGFAIIQWLRQSRSYKLLPVLVLSSSKEEQDVERAYVLGANSYLVKPGSLVSLEEVVRTTVDYWGRCEKKLCAR